MNKLLKRILAFSLKNKYFIFFATLLMVIAGVIIFQNMSIEAFPDVTNTEITLITQWPGRSAEEVEKFVTIPIEIALNPVQKKTSLRSTSIFGLSMVKLIFEDGVPDNYARTQVNNMLVNLTLPENISPQVQPPTGPTGEIFRYTLESDIRDPRELKTMQDWTVDRELRSVPGVADIVSFGGKVKAYEIKANPLKLADLGISALDVYNAVNRSNINIGGDVVVDNSQAYVVRGIGLLNDINEIKNIIVQNLNGIPILVKDVAEVEISNQPRLGQVGRSDAQLENRKRIIKEQKDVVEAIVLMRKGENAGEVIRALKERIDRINKRVLPYDTKIVPYYNREDLIGYATHTVLHNLVEGILLVTLLVSLFMFNWRTTLIVSIIIPIALLFSFICLHLMGMSANLLSLGAVDFGIIIDGAVVMVEGLFVALHHKALEAGMTKFNRLSKLGLIKNKGTELGKAIFFAKAIIITGLLPIFAFQKVEGKMFSPLAYTLGFALLGALITTLTLVPVLINLLLRKNVHEKRNPFVHFLTAAMLNAFQYVFRHRRIALVISCLVVVAGLYSFNFLGSEFLPELDEGSIWIRAQLPYSISLEKSNEVADQIRGILMQFPQVKSIASQTGRPDDGTDVTGFYNNEFDVILLPEENWKHEISKEGLIAQMQEKLRVIPGVDLNFSQPIMDNVEEAVSGVKGSICVKVFGDSLGYMENKVTEVGGILKNVKGIEDLGVIRNIGQPELDIELDQSKMALYGVATADANAVIEMAIGGKAATQLYEGIKKFDIRVRLPEAFRKNAKDIGDILVPTQNGSKVPIREIATITKKTAPCLIFRDDNQRYAALKFSVRGRDMGSTIAEAQEKVNKNVSLRKGYSMVWQGDFENQRRAENRLAQVVPIALVLIFILLFVMFGNLKDAALVFLNVPFAIVGGIFALLITGTHFSISAGIGFIALFGICIQDGVLLITVFKQNLEALKGQGSSLYTAIRLGVNSRIRPVMMTALMAAIGLFPAALSTGIGSESSRPLARVVIGGIVCAMLFSLLVFPLIFAWAYKKYWPQMEEGVTNQRSAPR
ncbi:CusA/CzcA family heavy metal efflux RND transporter [Flavitalea sp. BT771]|uniref:efflux RND transporter permease subunit n=1 Tax=Flavitalea sp. BT771 TaxID=3063329 RepID=UPI0026E20907|nr:CusA/CzcA family heavy metal efflux RND transporter [Flavitalea sp. BT771]MDO6433857.1 CusA/CzcA family heavy metal efflux RND transporter [Flavitalea sp. BT771]MDV6222238.1 CusA/CzcA family heavy metal efflux RND transporter [Flavitalea sp. BT771]